MSSILSVSPRLRVWIIEYHRAFQSKLAGGIGAGDYAHLYSGTFTWKIALIPCTVSGPRAPCVDILDRRFGGRYSLTGPRQSPAPRQGSFW